MKINYMLAYGSGEASSGLLWKFGLLNILLPFQVYIHFVQFLTQSWNECLLRLNITGYLFCSPWISKEGQKDQYAFGKW